MPRRGKTADIDARAFFRPVSWRLVAGNDDRLGALLPALITGSSGAAHIYAEVRATRSRLAIKRATRGNSARLPSRMTL